MLKKDLKFDIKSVAADGTFDGLLSVYDVIDLGNDVVRKGAFSKTIQETKGVVPMLWQHKTDAPIGTLELADTDEGLAVKGRFCLEVQQARDAYALVKAGVIRGLSIGYDAIKKKFQDGVRNLLEVKLYEGSIVTFPMLPAAQIASVKADKASDFLTELDEIRTFALRMQMMNALDYSLSDIVWDGELSDEDKIAAADATIQQFRDAYITFLPKLFAAWANYYKAKGKTPVEAKAGRRNSAADEAMLREMQSMIAALLGEEAAESTSQEAGKSTSAVGAAATNRSEDAVPAELLQQLTSELKGLIQWN